MNSVVLAEKSTIKIEGISHQKWRKVLIGIERDLQQLNPQFSVCGPFGFEMLWKAADAPKRIRKFYVYTNNPEQQDCNKLADIVENYAYQNIRAYYPEILDDFVIMAKNQSFKLCKPKDYICKSTDKLLDIQVRNIQENILVDYAKYLILVYQSIVTKTGEALEYKTSARCRSRMFQLFLASKKLYSDFLYEDAESNFSEVIVKVSPYISNLIQFFFDDSRDEFKPVSNIETKIIDQEVIPLCEAINNLLLPVGNEFTMNISIQSYHIKSPVFLSCSIDKVLYDALVEKVVSSYHNFI